MNGGTRIIALDGGPVDNTRADAVEHASHAGMYDSDPGNDDNGLPPLEPQGRLRWIIPGIATLLIVGWTVLLGWARLPLVQAGLTADAAINLVTVWALPVMLVLMGLLLARTTLRDASRHAMVIRALSQESSLLDSRLRAMNTELSLARDFIAAQSRDLESLGRIAVDRLSGSAEQLKDLIAGQGKDMDHIGLVSAKALENISTLRTHLPVISNSAKDAANAIALAGRTADTQLEELIAGFNRLNEFGTASGRKVDEVRASVDAALDAFTSATERIAQAGDIRLRAVKDALDAQRAQIDREEVAALAAIRARAEALASELAAQREVMAHAEEDSLAALAGRIAALDGDVRNVAAALARAIEEVGRDHDQLITD